MKLSKEMKVWVKQQGLRKQSCIDRIEGLKISQATIIKLIKLEKEQAKCINEETKAILKDWKDAK